MLHLLWNLINLAFPFYFFYLCLQATRLLRQHRGGWPASIFILGALVSLGNTTTSPKEEVQKRGMVARDQTLTKDLDRINIKLDQQLLTSYDLHLLYGPSKDSSSVVVVDAYSTSNGLSGGVVWKPRFIDVHSTGNTFKYNVTGILEWKLLGTTLYSQLKQYQGTIPLK